MRSLVSWRYLIVVLIVLTAFVLGYQARSLTDNRPWQYHVVTQLVPVPADNQRGGVGRLTGDLETVLHNSQKALILPPLNITESELVSYQVVQTNPVNLFVMAVFRYRQ